MYCVSPFIQWSILDTVKSLLLVLRMMFQHVKATASSQHFSNVLIKKHISYTFHGHKHSSSFFADCRCKFSEGHFLRCSQWAYCQLLLHNSEHAEKKKKSFFNTFSFAKIIIIQWMYRGQTAGNSVFLQCSWPQVSALPPLLRYKSTLDPIKTAILYHFFFSVLVSWKKGKRDKTRETEKESLFLKYVRQ